MPITTTLNRILAHQPCGQELIPPLTGWLKLLNGLGKTKADNEPLPFTRIVEINGIDDARWACRAEPQYAREYRLHAVWCAREIEHLMTDQRSRDALNVSERYANGEATEAELAAARDAAGDAARDAAWAATDAARDAAWAATDAAGNAGGAAWAAAGVARDTAWEAAWAAALAATDAAGNAGEAAWAAARAAQKEKFIEMCNTTNAR